MRNIIYLLLLPVFFFSCKTRNHKDILVPSNIPSQVFNINSSGDTVIRTSHAAIISIKKGTFSDETVQIEIKEAFTPEEILSAGITTMSNGKPLRSGGMLYFNATKNGKTITPLKSINVFIPSKDPDQDMLLFKGEESKDGLMNWTDPQPLDTSKPEDFYSSYEAGRALFLRTCASCHHIYKEGAYPALKNFQYRGPWKNPNNILAWVHNPPKFIAVDRYTEGLVKKYKSMMTAFPDLEMNDIKNLANYINNAKFDEAKIVEIKDSIQNGVDTSNYVTSGTSDCGSDTSYFSYEEKFPEYDTTIPQAIFSDTTDFPYLTSEDIVRDISKEGYEFDITMNGWYNIDAYLKTGVNQVDEITLFADLKMDEDIYMNVYVLVPTERINQWTDSKSANQYYFNKSDGKLVLPLNHRAVILSYGSKNDKIYYGVSDFTLTKNQTVAVYIKETTKEKLQNILYSKNLDGIDLKATEKRMEINKIDCNDYTGVSDTIPVARPK
jgi:mono/diheme cytochrome c family protein